MEIYKTQKMLINGAFVRSESNRTLPFFFAGDKEKESEKEPAGRYCLSSKKDLRNAVEAAASGLTLWQQKDAYNRGQILYRIAEMAASRSNEFVEILCKQVGISAEQATFEVEGMNEKLLFHAGLADKAQSLLSMLNPVMGSFAHQSTIEGIGPCALIEGDELDLVGFADRLCVNLVATNSLVVLVGAKLNPLLSLLAEIIAASDVPPGVINLLSGSLNELHEQIAGHYSLRAICYAHADAAIEARMRKLGSQNLKRFIRPADFCDSLHLLLALVEVKSMWQPTGF